MNNPQFTRIIITLVMSGILILLNHCGSTSQSGNPVPRRSNTPPRQQTESNIFVAYDEPPQPMGGFDAIQKNLQYPESAMKQNIQGQVVLQVLIGVDGSVLEHKVLKSIGHAECDQAAIKAVKSVRWRPAKQRDRSVKVWTSFPVTFKLNSK